MAARFKTKAYTFGAAGASLATIIGSSNDKYVGSVTLRAAQSNVGNVTWADPDGSVGGYLDGGEAASFDLTGKFVDTADIRLSGTENDVIYITVIG